ncbi:F510_1955 family glycosylhydrolase [Mycolicibacterium gilvum]|uniref:BNR/Asp-box repeat protein n=1 Tax=Mycolicibacterium gilvum TaxID=1804 RepID=A0A378SR37_9MYCO|nr:sialidase family protein [Mycolicibacterium gilvum]MCV7059306.1 exo-alpha-sialidase [Mycolicibacterium gilvum]STZ44376.1 BNR/Asp-box repeat protein [Mycolicibacterium gilvum]
MQLRRFIAAILTGALVAACSSNAPDSAPAISPGMVHIHGLGINPSDEKLYVATHYGLYTVEPDQAPQRVGDLAQDFMGFTVTGPDDFLASGHPDPADRQQPPHLGLIKSSDAGRSWESLSLHGSADFHALEYRHGRVYGHDSQSGTVMVSLDEQSWQRRAKVAAFDLAVSPADADEILATTRQGLLRSTDGAMTFGAVSGAPALVLVSWPERGPLLGADLQGTLYTSTNNGQTWQPQHALNAKPQALFADGDGQVYIATDTAIYTSTDDGATVNVLTAVE